MMSKSILFVFILLSIALHAQWNPSGANIYNANSGNVGVGTTSPTHALSIQSTAEKTLLVKSTSHSVVDIESGNGLNSYVRFINNGIFKWDLTSETTGNLRIYNYLTNQSNVVIAPSGNMGLGLSNPQFKLEMSDNSQLAIGKTYVDNSLDVENAYTRSNFGSNVYWDAVNNFWQVRPIGNNDFSSIIHPNADGLVFLTAASTGNVSRSLTHSEFMSYEKMRIKPSGSVGIGTSSPEGLLHLGSSNLGVGTTKRLLLEPPYHTGAAWEFAVRDDVASSYLGIGYGKESVTIHHEGNVGIGTTNPDAKLAVKGQVHANEVKVDLNVQGPDYVFEPTYTLPSLDSVQSYINQNKHLPEVPSAKEMEANGVNLGEMNMLLLKKVEELTLYMIQLKTENERLNHLSEEVDLLKKQMSLLNKK